MVQVCDSYRLDRIRHYVSRDDYVALLSDAVDAVDGLRFCHGVPVRFHEVDVVGDGEVEADDMSACQIRIRVNEMERSDRLTLLRHCRL